MSLHTGLPVTNIGQPGAFAAPNVTRQIISDLQILKKHYWSQFVEKYGDQADYFTFLSTFAGMELAGGRDFYHYEDFGKLLLAVATTGAVTQSGSGANVVLTLSADSHYALNGTSYSPARIGEEVRLASSGMEGKIVAKSTATPGAHTITVKPNSTAAFTSAGSATIVSGEVLVLLANSNAGEASSDIDTQTDIDTKVTGSIMTIRDDWKATDLSEMEEVEYKYDGETPVSSGGIKSAYTLKGLVKFNKRYMAITSEKLMKGDVITNTGLATSAVGTQGMLPAIAARGGTTTYTGGAMTIANLHTALRYQLVQGSAKQIQWLQDAFQNTDFSDLLTSTYSGGAYVYGTSNGAASKEASAAYGFKEFFIDGFLLQAKVYPFNTEILTGRAPAIDQYRDFGVLIPQGTTLSKGKTISNVTVMYQEPPAISAADGSVGNGIRAWRYGGASPNATDGNMVDKVSMISYKGVRCAGINQFQRIVGQ